MALDSVSLADWRARGRDARRSFGPCRNEPGSFHGVWEAALAVPAWAGRPVWMHGDLHPANLLVEGRELSAVIDFGLLGVGDPACDLVVAWAYLSAESRDV